MVTKLHELSGEDIGDPNIPVERQRRDDKSGSALVTMGTAKGLQKEGQQKKKFNGRCTWCQKLGHFEKDCRNKASGKPRKSNADKAHNANKAHVAQEEQKVDPDFAFTCEEAHIGYEHDLDKWILDSGASHHYAKDRKKLHKNCRAHDGHVITAGKENLKISAIGTHTNFGQVKLVKDMGRNLLSIGQMTKNPEIRINFHEAKCIMTKGMKVIATATKGSDNLYRIDDTDDDESDNEEIHQALQSDNDDDSQDSESDSDEFLNYETHNPLRDWHRRLGHLSKTEIKHLVRKRWISISKKDLIKKTELHSMHTSKGSCCSIQKEAERNKNQN